MTAEEETRAFLCLMMDKIPSNFTLAHIEYMEMMLPRELEDVKNNFKYLAKIPQSDKESGDGSKVEKFVDDFIADGRFERLEEEVKTLKETLKAHIEQERRKKRDLE